ncbi:AAA family ATPase [Crocinitomix sp.]|nr:AAA family ATPase [Crocinitomix sp.]
MKNKILKPAFKSTFELNLGFSPNKDQTVVIDGLTDFLWTFNDPLSDGLELYILTGYAGTGKTSLIGGFVNSLPSLKLKSVLLAPTGRAAKVLSNYSGVKASTIHRKIYFKNESEGDDGFTLSQNKHTNTVFIVDEASMIATSAMIQGGDRYSERSLLDDLIEYVYSGQNCKLIFVGDKGQLPPVGMAQSPALEVDFLKSSYGLNLHRGELNEIVRQSEQSGILDIAGVLRNFEETPPRLPVNTIDAKSINGTELQEELESAIQTHGRDEVMVVTRSNKRANLFNEQIRRRILWQEEDLNAGDVIMATRNNYHWLDAKSDAGFIANGELMEILKIVRREEIFGCEFADIIVRLIDYPEMKDVELKILLNSIRHEGPSLPREDLKLLFYRIGSEEYPYIRNQRDRNRKVMQNPYFQAVQVKFGYAVTCHKAQGGQWKAVFVDHGYFIEDMWDIEYMRWLYTAITRASSQLFLVNFAPHFVGEHEL